jgi:hypothetical protein
MSKIAHCRASIKRERRLISEWTAERCRAAAADCRRAGDIAAFMGDDQPTSDLLHGFARELEDAAKQKEETN